MKLAERFRKFSLLNKLIALAAIATIVGFFITVITSICPHSSNEPSLDLHAGITFDRLYFQNFKESESYDSKWDMREGAPANLRDLGPFRYYGLHPFLWLRIFNNGDRPLSVRAVDSRWEFGSDRGDVNTWQRYWSIDLSKREAFPVFLNPQQEVVVVLDFPWPVSEEFQSRLHGLHEDSVYTAEHLGKVYLEGTGKYAIGSPAASAMMFGEWLMSDLVKQTNGTSESKGCIRLAIRLSGGQSFKTEVPLPPHR